MRRPVPAPRGCQTAITGYPSWRTVGCDGPLQNVVVKVVPTPTTVALPLVTVTVPGPGVSHHAGNCTSISAIWLSAAALCRLSYHGQGFAPHRTIGPSSVSTAELLVMTISLLSVATAPSLIVHALD